MILTHPFWLLLAIPLALTLWLLKPPTRSLQVMRIIILTLVLLAMSGPSIILPLRQADVVVVVDRSKSMPPNALDAHKEAVDLVQAQMGRRDRLAVISFGGSPAVEQFPQNSRFSGFVAEVDADASDLSRAIDAAVALIPRDAPGRILVLSDGRWSGSDPLSAAARAAAAGIAIDYRIMEREGHNDLAVAALDGPGRVAPGEGYMIHAWIQSPVRQEVSYRLIRGADVIAAATTEVSSGLTRLTFRDRAAESGAIQYRFDLPPRPEDPVPENNTARLLLGVQGAKRLLCVSRSPDSGLAALLTAGGLQVDLKQPAQCRWGLEDLANYAAVLLEDVPASAISEAAMSNLAAWIRDTGAGLMMTGGKSSYGSGGYFKSPLEPVMPVSMELRKEHRKLSLAIVVVLDRSGSMGMTVPGGRTKMELANLATAQVLDLLSGSDEFGVIAVDSSPHVILNLSPVQNAAAQRSKILSIGSMGGGIFVYEGLSAGAKMLASATAGTRHIILFSDAADSEQPGDYINLLEQCTRAGMTVSVIGLGSTRDVDAALLEDIARRGQGRCFFTESAQELPRLFAQDTFVVARSSFLEDPVQVAATGAMAAITGRPFDMSHGVGGYNLCYLRPEADCAVISLDEYSAPIVASWHVGAGRVLCYTPQADGEFTGEIANWPRVGDFLASMARWVTGDLSELGPEMLLTQEIADGQVVVKLHLNPERPDRQLAELPELTTLQGIAGRTPVTRKLVMDYHDADMLLARIPLGGSETLLSTIRLPDCPPVTLPPTCLPYSPEFRLDKDNRGQRTMKQLAAATGGCERIVDLGGIWKDLPRTPRLVPLAPWLVLLVVVILLAEVLERRSGIVSAGKLIRKIQRLPIVKQSSKKPALKVRRVQKASLANTTVSRDPQLPQSETRSKQTQDVQEPEGLFGAMSKARRKAGAIINRKK